VLRVLSAVAAAILALAGAAAALAVPTPKPPFSGPETPSTVATVTSTDPIPVTGGLFGIVKRGPVTPVCRVGVPCEKPAVGIRVSFLLDGSVVASAVTGAHGRYRVELAPGTYAVSVPRPAGIGGVKPQTVTVGSAMARLDLFVDTGIR